MQASTVASSSISDPKLRANRENARKSTGPRTADGKAASSRNATRHGLYAANPILPGEDPADFEQFHDELLDDLDPVGALQAALAERAILLAWKLRRISAAEAETFAFFQEEDSSTTIAQAMARSLLDESAPFERLTRHEQRLSNMFHRTLRELREMKKHQRPLTTPTAPASDKPTPQSSLIPSPNHALTQSPTPPPTSAPNEPTATPSLSPAPSIPSHVRVRKALNL